MRKSKTVSNVIIGVVVLLVLALVVGLVIRFTDVKDKVEDIVNPTFHIEYDGRKYTGQDNTVTLPSSGQAKFTVKGGGTFSIKVTPNVTADTDFSYIVDHTKYKYSNTNIGKLFLNADTFKDNVLTIDCGKDYSINAVLSELYGGAEVDVDASIEFPYLLTVTSGSDTISIAFGTKSSGNGGNVDGITLSPDHIEF